MNNDHEYLKRMQTEYGAVIQARQGWESAWTTMAVLNFHANFSYRICPIWLEERLKNSVRIEEGYWDATQEHEFQMGQTYWHVNSSGCINEDTWENTFTDTDVYGMGNAFHTEEEAQVARDRQLARVRVERRIKELNGDWKAAFYDNSQVKWSIEFSMNELTAQDYKTIHHSSAEWTGTHTAIEKVIEEMPDVIGLAMGWDYE